MKFAKVKSILDEGERYGAGPGRGCVVYYKHRQVDVYKRQLCSLLHGIPGSRLPVWP